MAIKSILFVFLLALASCVGLVQSLVKPPKVDVDSISLAGMSMKGMDLEIHLKVDNPNPNPVRIDKLKYNLSIGDSSLINGVFDKFIELKANDISTVTIPVKLDYTSAKSAVENYVFKSIDTYKFNGEITSGVLTVPVNDSGKIVVKK
jgi:LEA14-like dessication related protein